jgi:hypothetical protein
MENRVHACEDLGMARPKTGETPVRHIKIGDDWDALGDAVGTGRRAKAVRAAIAWFLTVQPVWSHYESACTDEGITPEEDLRRYIETKVRDWHRAHADE